VILREKLYLQADQKAQIFKTLLSGHPKIKDIRHIGLMMAVELESAEQCSRMIRLLAENGAVADAFLFRPQAFRIGPPLIITEEEIQKAGKIILHCLDQL
jgi:4-aminobutyrate aminotransferase-like enzyme